MYIETFTWSQLASWTILLTLIYLGLRFVNRIMTRFDLEEGIIDRIQKIIHIIMVIYEPFVFIILAGIFIFINPPLHGLIVGLLLLVGFTTIKSYMLGRTVHIDNSILEGKRMQTADTKGLITRIGNIGLHLRNNEGEHYITYNNLMKQGYSLLSTDEVGGYYQLELTPKANNNQKNKHQHLMDLLVMAPYIDSNRIPKLLEGEGDSLSAKLVIRKEAHLNELIELLNEWGYTAKLK